MNDSSSAYDDAFDVGNASTAAPTLLGSGFDFATYCNSGGLSNNETLYTTTTTTTTTTNETEVMPSMSAETAAICALYKLFLLHNDNNNNDNDNDNATRGNEDITANSTESLLVSPLFMLILSGIFILAAVPAHVLRLAGCGRTDFVQDNLVKSCTAVLATAVMFYFFGYAFAFGHVTNDDNHDNNDDDNSKSFCGTHYRALKEYQGEYATVFQYFAYCLASAGIMSGSMAERAHMATYFYGALWYGLWIWPIVAHTLWSNQGLLSPTAPDPFQDSGVIDAGGVAVVHFAGGMAALITAKMCKTRPGRFYDLEDGHKLEHPTVFPAHNEVYQVVGTALFWLAAYGPLFGLPNANSASLAALNITLSATMAGFVALVTEAVLQSMGTGYAEYDVTALLRGVETGLVSISGCAPLVEPWAAVVIGILGGLVFLGGKRVQTGFFFLRADDPVYAVSVHAFGGLFGILAVAIFSKGELLQQAGFRPEPVGLIFDFPTFGFILAQVTGVAFIIGWVAINTGFYCFILKKIGILRIYSDDEDQDSEGSSSEDADKEGEEGEDDQDKIDAILKLQDDEEDRGANGEDGEEEDSKVEEVPSNPKPAPKSRKAKR